MTKRITINRTDLDAFCAQWPCHGIPTTLASITFWFADNGDLVDILAKSRNGRRVDSATFDGPALVALSQDAQVRSGAYSAALAQPEQDIKFSSSGSCGGKPAWSGEYRVAGQWRKVRNNAGYIISYASTEAAVAAAKWKLSTTVGV